MTYKTQESRSRRPSFQCAITVGYSGFPHKDYRSLCAPVMICATLVSQKVFCPLCPLWPRKVGQVPGSFCSPVRCTYDANLVTAVRRSVACRDNADISIFYDALKPSKVGQGELVFGLQGLFISMSLCAKFQVSVSSGYDLWQHLMSQTDRPTNQQTDRRTDSFVQSIWIAQLVG